VLGRIFAVTAAICAGIFMVWFLLIHGPGQTVETGSGNV
jgi:hypothetical protein